MKSKHSLLIVSAVFAFTGNVHAATTGWNQTAAGPWDYNTTTNWVGNTINGIWNSDLTLAAAQTVTFGANTVLGTGWTFNYGGNFGLTLRGDTADRTVTLGGNISVNPSSDQTITIGSATTNQKLNVNLGGVTRTFTVNANKGLTFVNVLSNGGITKTGAGTLNLSGANTFAGQLTVEQGTLAIGSINNTSANGTLGNSASSVILSSSGNTGTLQYTGASAASSKKFTMAASGTGAFDVTNAATTLTLSGVVDGATGNLTKTGSGTLALSATSGNTYTGTTTVSGGVLRLDSANALPGGIGSSGGTSGLALAGGVLGLGNGDFSRGLGTGASQVQFTGNGGFAAYAADRVINLGGVSATVTWNSGNFVTTGSALFLGAASADRTVDFQNPIDLNGATRTIQVDDGTAVMDGKLSGNITGSGGGLVKSGNGFLALSGTNSFDGGTAVNTGALILLNTQAKPATGTITVASGATLGLGVGGTGFFSSTDVDNLFANTLANTSMATTANVGIDTSAGDFTYGSSLGSLTKGLVKLGGNTLTLSGSNAFTGPTTIQSGTLALANTGAIASSSGLTLANGTTLALRSNSTTTFSTPVTTVPVSATVTIDVNNNGSGSGNTLTMGTVTATPPASLPAIQQQINITGGNGYTLRIPTLNWLSPQGNGTRLTLNPTSASVVVDQFNYAAGSGSQGVILDGISTGNVISKANSTTWLVLEKKGAGTWTWGVNSQTTGGLGNQNHGLSDGTLIVTGSLFSTAAGDTLA